MNTPREWEEAENVAMNIVYQLGDALYDALPNDVAHEHFVKARQATNDIAIDFAVKLIRTVEDKAREEERERVRRLVEGLRIENVDRTFTEYGYNMAIDRVLTELKITNDV